MRVAALGFIGLLLAVTAAPCTAAALPDAATLLADLGYTPDQIASVQAGEMVRADLKPSTPRELTTALAFQVPVAPAKLVADLRSGLLVKVDPDVKQSGAIRGNGSAADFAGVTLANPQDLIARVTAYRAKGLAGIAPVMRGSEQRSIADELRSATQAAKPLAKYAPAAYQLLLDYPAGAPAGFNETFRWTQFDAHGTPTLALTHAMYDPDGDAYLVVQRQFYVTTGYNCEQAIAVFVPTNTGTVVIYGNRTSTDQITGFGGSAKRSIGDKMLAEQLEDMFQKVRTDVK